MSILGIYHTTRCERRPVLCAVQSVKFLTHPGRGDSKPALKKQLDTSKFTSIFRSDFEFVQE